MRRFRRPRSWPHTLRRIAAGLLATAALVLALRPPPDGAPAADPETRAVVVAARDLAPGTLLTTADLTVARYPPDLVAESTAGEPADLLGRVLAAPLRNREPVTDVRLVGAGLTATLPAGEVAAPVRLADLAVASLVRAGDRVDVLATAPDATEAELIAERALVLVASSADPDDAAGDAATAGLLLLAVDEETAAQLAAASSRATLTASLVGS
jgi:pilus assembly protein CpaB